MKILTMTQGGGDWLAARAGLVTASRCGDVMSKRKDKKESSDHYDYRIEIATEILTGVANENYVSKDMIRGTELEPLARAAYERQFDCEVDLIGLIQHPSIEQFAASPDGLVGDRGGVEFKAPRDTTYVRWADKVDEGLIPEEHFWQCYAGMACCEREWWDWCPYSLNMPRHMRSFRVRLARDDKKIAELESGVKYFIEEVQQTIARLEQIFGKAPQLAAPNATTNNDLSEYGISDEDIRAADPAWKGSTATP